MALMIYVDESGQPHQLDEGPYVIASVAIDENNLDAAVDAVKGFLERVSRVHGVNVGEIHTKCLVKGVGDWYGVPMRVRKAVFDEFAQLISGLDMVLNIVVVRKGRPGAKISSPEGIRKHAVKLLVERIFMTPSTHPVAILVFDSSTIGQDANIKRDVEEAVRTALTKPSYRIYVAFKDSREEPLLQVADYVAYVTRYIYTHQYRWKDFSFENAFLSFEDRVRRCPGQDTYEGCGLKVWEITR